MVGDCHKVKNCIKGYSTLRRLRTAAPHESHTLHNLWGTLSERIFSVLGSPFPSTHELLPDSGTWPYPDSTSPGPNKQPWHSTVPHPEVSSTASTSSVIDQDTVTAGHTIHCGGTKSYVFRCSQWVTVPPREKNSSRDKKPNMTRVQDPPNPAQQSICSMKLQQANKVISKL